MRKTTRSWKKALMAVSAAALLVPAAGLAEGAGEQAQQAEQAEQAQQAEQRVGNEPRMQREAGERSPRTTRPRAVLDVEELNDNPLRYAGETITVAGEVEELLGGHTFVLESGGLIDDEVAVIVPPRVRSSVVGLAEDAELVVTGQVRAMEIVEVERELGLDLNPEFEAELEGVRHFLVAERIAPQR